MVPNSLEGPAQNPTPMMNTVKTGLSPSKLIALGKRVTEEDLDVRLLSDLRKHRIGTFKIECEALKLHDEAMKGESKNILGSKWDKIRGGRDAGKVEDLLKLKIGYAQKRKKELRKEYVEEKRRLEEGLKSEGRERKFGKIMKRNGQQHIS